MKSYHTKRIEKLRSIALLLSEYQTTFAVVQHDSNRVSAFIHLVDELQALHNGLQVPLSIVIKQRTATHLQLAQEMGSALGRCISLAKSLNDSTMVNTLLFYATELRYAPTLKRVLSAAAVVITFLGLHVEEAEAVGFSTERISLLQQLAAEAEGKRDNSSVSQAMRRVDRKKLQSLLTEARALLNGELDWIIADYRLSAPVMHERYHMLRQRRKGIKSSAEVFTDVSGMVTHAITGDAIANAQLLLVNAAGFETTTGADGYFLIDGLEPGAYQLRCMATGYDGVNDVAFSIQKGESLQVNFGLSPQQAVA